MLSTILTLVVIASAAPAVTQTAPAPPGGPMRALGGGMVMGADTDRDGVVTRAEAMAQAAERFDRMDANRDGRIDRAEIAQLRDAWRDRRGSRGDRAPVPQQ